MKQTSEFQSLIATLCDPAFDRVLIACHRAPDGDACGSAHALSYALRCLGKSARVFCPDPFPAKFEAIFRAEQDLGAFVPEHFVTVDIAAPEMLGGADFTDRIDIVIDHHRINTVTAPLKIVNFAYASCGEIIFDILEELGVTTDAYLARCLYTAISSDTGCFRYSNTSEHTFLCAAALCRAAHPGDFWQINRTLFETRTRTQLKLESFAAEHTRFLCDGRLAVLCVNLALMHTLGATYEELEILVGFIRMVEGVEVAIVLKEKEAGVFKVSVRSEETFDASGFCQEFGGGGHLAAAGCTIRATEEEAMSAVIFHAEKRLS